MPEKQVILALIFLSIRQNIMLLLHHKNTKSFTAKYLLTASGGQRSGNIKSNDKFDKTNRTK